MSSPFWLLLILGLLLQAGTVWTGADARAARPAAVACAACEAEGCECCDLTGCSVAASAFDASNAASADTATAATAATAFDKASTATAASLCGCVELPFSEPVDSAPLPPSRPVGYELAAGPVWIEVRQDMPSLFGDEPYELGVSFGVATRPADGLRVALTVRFCAFLI